MKTITELMNKIKDNLEIIKGEVIISNLCEGSGYKTKFTQAEINELKQRDDLAIDWDKVIIKPVEDE